MLQGCPPPATLCVTGLPPSMFQVLDLAAVANPMFKLKGPKMLKGDHAPNFPLQAPAYL